MRPLAKGPAEDDIVRALRKNASQFQAFRLRHMFQNFPEPRVLDACRRERVVTFKRAGELWASGFGGRRPDKMREDKA